MGKPRTARQEQFKLRGELRASGKTWAEIARVLAEQYGVNMRVAFRLARGWSQREAADEWNHRWPAKPKTFKNFSYWELWPAATGHAPSLEVLTCLAEIYECAVSDLLADGPRFDHRDEAQHSRQQLARLPFILQPPEHMTNGPGGVRRPTPTMNTPAGPADNLSGLIQHLDQVDVEELARTVASWAKQTPGIVSRRGLLLKLSAGLALAAGDSELAGTTAPVPEPRAGQVALDLSGTWRSRYLYYSDSRSQEFEGEHYVVLRQRGNRLVGENLPHSKGSSLQIDLSVDASIATGTWRERTSPTGYYQGATYHGTLQLVVNPMGRAMSGRWLGFGKNFKVNTGEWELTWVDAATSARATRDYHLKV